jgi:hypothetical protein
MAQGKLVKLGGQGWGRVVRKAKLAPGVIGVKAPRQTWRIR